MWRLEHHARWDERRGRLAVTKNEDARVLVLRGIDKLGEE